MVLGPGKTAGLAFANGVPQTFSLSAAPRSRVAVSGCAGSKYTVRCLGLLGLLEAYPKCDLDWQAHDHKVDGWVIQDALEALLARERLAFWEVPVGRSGNGRGKHSVTDRVRVHKAPVLGARAGTKQAGCCSGWCRGIPRSRLVAYSAVYACADPRVLLQTALSWTSLAFALRRVSGFRVSGCR